MIERDCTGCAHIRRRFKYSKPRKWCKRYRQFTPDVRCIDYRIKSTFVAVLKKAVGL